MSRSCSKCSLKWLNNMSTNIGHCSLLLVQRLAWCEHHTVYKNRPTSSVWSPVQKNSRPTQTSSARTHIGTKCSPTHWKHSSIPPEYPTYSNISAVKIQAQISYWNHHVTYIKLNSSFHISNSTLEPNECMFKKPNHSAEIRPRSARNQYWSLLKECWAPNTRPL